MINLLIAGYHGYGNCGDEAILQAMTTNIRKMAADVNITALSYRPDFTKTEYGINSVQRFNIPQVLSAIRQSDIILSGGGTLLQNGTSTRSLLYYLSIIKAAKHFKKRVMLYANGIGPVMGRLNRRLVKSVVDTVDVITLREKLSEQDLRSIGVTNPNVTVTADPAFKLESIASVEAEELLKAEGIPSDGQRVAVCVRAWSKAQYGDDYVVKIARVCDDIVKSGKNVVLLPMEFPKDIEISGRVCSAMKQKSYMLEKRYTPEQILGIIGRFDLMISMRLHSLIFAAVQNVPMVGIIYDPKIEYYLRELDMPEGGDVRSERLDSVKIYSQVCEIFDNMEKYKACLKAKADTMIKKADENDRLLSAQLSLIRNKRESLI